MNMFTAFHVSKVHGIQHEIQLQEQQFKIVSAVGFEDHPRQVRLILSLPLDS